MRKMTLEIYREVIAEVKAYEFKKARINDIMEEITSLKSRPDIFTNGGDGISQAERATRMYELARKRYYSLFESVEAIELAINGIVFNDDNEEHGGRLSKAIILNCKNRKQYPFHLLKRKFKLGLEETWFFVQKRRFIEDVAEKLGYFGTLEMYLVSA